jgi:hypothetical protein
MNVTALLSFLTPNANKLARIQDRMSEKGAQFVVQNTRLGRTLIDMIGERRDLAWIVQRLTDLELDPIVIGAFRANNGRKLRNYPLDRAAWRAVAPDVQTGVNAQGEPIYGRPSLGEYRQTHGWLGWPTQQPDVEEGPEED